MKVGVDIGGSHIAIALVNQEGKILEKIEEDIVKDKNLKQYVVHYVDKGIEKLNKNGDIEGIGIAVPGSPSGTVAKNLVNLGIEEINFEFLEKKYNTKVSLINDAKAAAIAEKKYGALKKCKDGVFLCLGTGIGGAVFLNDMLLKANKNPGFELGHMIIDKNGIPCNCGKRGCFETYCSMKRFKEKIKNILEKKYHNENILKSDEIIDSVILKELLTKNIQDKEIQSIIEEYINNLIIGLSNIIDIFEPEVVCLGGSFVFFKDILYMPLLQNMKDKEYVFNKNFIPKIVLAELKNDAGIIGATL